MRTLLTRADSYKHGHYKMMKPSVTWASCYLEARWGKFPVCFAGIQGLLKRYFWDLDLHPITMEHVRYAESRIQKHSPAFNRAGWERIVNKHGGYIPMKIRAVPEGTVVPVSNVLMTVESTDPELPWIPGFFETLLHRVWYPTTVASQSRAMKKIIARALTESSDDPESEIWFKLHNMGARGSTSGESSEISDFAHMMNFKGTDSLEGCIDYVEEYYNETDVATSIDASEHSAILSWGKNGELECTRNLLEQCGTPGRAFSSVSDTYDLWDTLDRIWGKELKQKLIESGAFLVARPDSGDPEEVAPEVMRHLEANFGSRINGKGYKVLNHSAVIQSDSVKYETLAGILDAVMKAKFSISNLTLGSGGGLVQRVDRDTLGFAYKCSAVEDNGVIVPTSKDPKTDSKKRSKAGVLDLIRTPDGSFETVSRTEKTPHPNSVMRNIWENGSLLIDENLSTIRKRAHEGIF